MIDTMKNIFRLLFIFFFSLLLCSISCLADYDWSQSMILSSESTSNAYRASVSVDRFDTFHVCWKDHSPIRNAGSDWDIFYRYKEHDKEWSRTELVTSLSTNDSNCLSIATDSFNTVHLVFKDQTDMIDAGSDWDIFYMYKPWNEPWSLPILLSTKSTDLSSCPFITIDNNDGLHVIWSDATDLFESGNDMDIFYRYKPINENWSSIELVTLNSSVDTSDAVLVVDSTYIPHVVWYEENMTTENKDIMYTKKSDQDNWLSSEIVSSGCYMSSTDPSIVIDSNDGIHIIWNDKSNLMDNGEDYDIFYRSKPFSGEWYPIALVSTSSHTNGKWPIMKIDQNDTLYIAWTDKVLSDVSGSDYDIVLTYKPIDETFSPVEIVSKESNYDSNWPRFDIDSNGRIHMTWWDRTTDQWITYYNTGFPQVTSNNKDVPSIACYGVLFGLVILFLVKRRKNKKC